MVHSGQIEGLDLVINERYRACIDELRQEAASTTRDVGNPIDRLNRPVPLVPYGGVIREMLA